MKRERNEDESKEIDENNALILKLTGLPKPFFIQLEPYLTDRDLSAFCRASKSYMILCYFRIAKVLLWSNPYRDIIEIYFPADPFLQMQIAKVELFAPAESLMSIPTTMQEFVKQDQESEKEMLKLAEMKSKWPLSFSSYMERICFVDCKNLNSQIRQIHCMASPRAFLIISGDPLAKALLYIQLQDFDKYHINRSKGAYRMSCLDLALKYCDSITADIRIIINEVELGLKNNNKDRMETIVFEDLDEHRNFFYLENPVLFHYFKYRQLFCVENFVYELIIRQVNGLQRCKVLIEAECFTIKDVLTYSRRAFRSFLSDGMDSDDESSIHKYLDFFWEEDERETNSIKILASYKPLKSWVLKRLRKILPYIKQHLHNEEKTYPELLALANSK